MTIPPIGALTGVAAPTPASGAGAAGATAATSSSGFGSTLSNAVNSLQQSQTVASADEAKLATGQGNLADTMIAASEASLQTQVTNDLLTKAITSYNNIMNMSF